MSIKLNRVNRFSKEYYLYPEEMRQAEKIYEEELKMFKAQKEIEAKSKKAHVKNLEQTHNQDIDSILKNRGFYLKYLPLNAEWLPISIFDDIKYELSTPAEWLSIYQDGGEQIEFCGKTLKRNEDTKDLEWIPVKILSFNTENSKWMVEDSSGNQFESFRINLVFNCEDKNIFSMRLIQAYSERIFLDSFIRYNFYIDSMPILGISPLSKKIIENILSSSRNLKNLKEKEIINEQTIIKMIESFYFRTYNKTLFNEQMKKNKEIFALKNQLIFPDDFFQNSEKKERGLIPLSRHNLRMEQKKENCVYPASMNFQENFKLFCLNSICNKKPVLKILKEIEEANKRVLNNPMFETNFNDSLTFETFRNNQESAVTKFMNHCKINWLKDVIMIITKNLKDETTGWFNLKNINMENYHAGKLKSLLNCIDMKLADVLKNIVIKNFSGFIKTFISYCPESVDIVSSAQVKNQWKNKQTGEQTSTKLPLFLISVKIDENKVVLPEMPDLFVEFILVLIQKSIEELSRLNRIEEQILKSNLDNKFDSFIHCPNLKQTNFDESQSHKVYENPNQWLIDIFDVLKEKLKQAIIPANNYLDFYKSLDNEFSVSATDYIAKIEANNKNYTIKNLLEEIEKVKQREIDLISRFPNDIQVSLFKIENNDIHLKIKEMSAEIERSIFKLIEEKGKTQTNELLTKSLKALKSKMKEKPRNIEEMTSLNEYLQTDLMDELSKISEQIEDLREIYNVLEENKIKVVSDDMKKFWMVVGRPKEIIDTKRVLQQEFLGLKTIFEKEMTNDQTKFEIDVESIRRNIEVFNKNYDTDQYEEIYHEAGMINDNLQDMIKKANMYNSRETLLKKKPTDYAFVFELEKNFKPLYSFWKVVWTWIKNREPWMNDSWEKVDAIAAENFSAEGLQVISQTINFLNEMGKKQYEKLVKNATSIRREIEDFALKVPVLVALKREGMSDRHWELISSKIGEVTINPKNTDNFNFKYIISLGLLEQKAFCIEIGERASRENEIEKAMKKICDKWSGIEIETMTYKRDDLFVVKTFDKVETELDEDFSTTNSMLINPFRFPFEAEIIRLNDSLLLVSNLIDEWRRFQSQWAYLQPIFDSADISRQLPSESNLFKKIDLFYKQFLFNVNKTKNMMAIAQAENILEKVIESNADLEIIQKELNNYLEVKRGKFARFYFLSNDELLSILSETKEVTKIQNHLRKVFENLGSLVFNEKVQIVGMTSLEGEKVMFSTPVNPLSKQVEDWMTDVENQMIISMKRELKKAIVAFDPARKTEWVLQHPGQCILNGFQNVWTNEVEQAIISNSLADYLKALHDNLIKIVMMSRVNFSAMNQISIEALIVIEVHALNVLENLIKCEISNISAFEWISQLRYYLINDSCFVKCIQTEFPYGYEYLGNTSRLVITPLTDKCYMTLMGALRLNLGGAPAGPAGTGKTETTKDLAKALAKQCVVFNCQESMDYLFLAKFFKGLASSGAWCCFDEFNRINIEVLSVIAQQLQELFRAKAEKLKEIKFEDTIIKIEPTFSVYITMNPGYAGRTELPDNLKALFRAVAMMVPDYVLIAEIKLYSFGFTKAKELAQKMVDTFKLSSEQLSNQSHYDYGMRAVTSVINAAGLFKQMYADKEGMTEEQLLFKALLDVNVPKFLNEDIPLFSNIVKDLFPSLIFSDQRNQKLHESILISCRNLNLQPEKRFIEKVLQFYDTIQVRHGLMLVGAAGSGKSSVHKVLENALNLMASNNSKSKPVKTDLISPKSMSLVELYGESKDLNWNEGVIEMVMEKAINKSISEFRWIMFDGPVDAVWIESMNTVLDDNKKLCLASGKVLILTPSITMMFEVEDLRVASPATVSRCGMIYIDTENMSFNFLFNSYLNLLPDEIITIDGFEESFLSLIESIFTPCLEFHKTIISDDIFEIPEVIIIQGFIRLFDSLISEVKLTLNLEAVDNLFQCLRDLIIFCSIWSVGCLTNNETRLQFEEHLVKNVLKDKSFTGVFDKEFDLKSKTWKNFNAEFENYEIPSLTPFHEIVLPTLNLSRGIKLNQILLLNKNSVLIPGSVGSGKTICAFKLFADYLPKDFNSLSLSFSAQTTPKQITDYFFSQIEKRKKGVFGPKNGKKCVIFLDDLNMPMKEEWGAQPPLELLRQYLDHGFWHVMKFNKECLKIEDIVVIGAMVPPKAGRNDISRRLVRHFNVIPLTDFDQKVMQSIYEKVLNYFLVKKMPDSKMFIPTIVEASIEVFSRATQQLLPTPSKCHYIFNLRDLAKTIHGIASLQESENLKNDFWLLWYHENERAYADRLSEKRDIDLLRSILDEVLKKRAGFESSDLLQSTDLVFSSIPTGVYSKLESNQILIQSIEKLLDRFNVESPPKMQMKLVMFLDACKYVSRMVKVLQNPQGHVLILGVGGSGRQSLSKLSTFICSLKPFQIEQSKGYNIARWKEDLKKLYLSAVCDNNKIGFIINDLQITNESFLEDINSLLNTGLLAGLPLIPDELKRLEETGRVECQRRNLAINKMNILNSQISILKGNLHVLLAMSPAHEKFAQRVRMFPSFVNCCSLNWMHNWPDEALTGVAKQFLTQNFEIDNTSDVIQVFKSTHKFVEELSIEFYKVAKRTNHLTSTSYLELLNTYKRIFNLKNSQLIELLNRFETGVQKLFEANQQVEEIRNHLKNEEPKLKIAEVEVKELLQKLAVDKETENETKKIVALEEAEAATQQIEANALKKSAEESVRVANEELERTLEKIQLLKPANIIEIRTANNPVRKVKLVMMTLCYLLLDNTLAPGFMKKQLTEEEFWVIGKNNLLNDPNKLFNTLMAPETKDQIETTRTKKVSEIVKKNLDVWNEKEMKNSSLANYYLYLWVDCMLNYTDINEKTKPIRDKLEEVTKILDEKTLFLEKKKAELEASTKRLKSLEDLYNEKISLKEELFRRINECNIKLERASKLTSLLEDETGRWKNEIVNISSQLKLVTNDSLFISCQMAYFGPFDSTFRSKIESFLILKMKELQLKISPNLKMVSFLSNPIETLNWSILGLPKDETSVINGILIHKSQRWPLMIDPQSRANKFIKNIGRTLPFGLEVIKASSPNLIRLLEQAIQLGKWVLVENLGLSIDPLLEPILQQKIFPLSGGKAISLGDKMVPYNENFKFLMSTSLQNPAYSPEVFAKVTIINFCITQVGLEEHLLAQVMLFENKELENKKTEIVVINADDKQKLKEIEDNILSSLRESKGDVLSDESLIMRLTQSKKTFSEINTRILEATTTEKEIDEIREKYRDCAYFASFLYFLVSELLTIDSMYQYSLQWFENLFQISLQNSLTNSDIPVRLTNIKDYFIYALYENICGSLYSHHKTLFSFLLTVRTLQAYNQLDPIKYSYFLIGNVEETKVKYERSDYVSENAWPSIIKELSGMDQLNNCEGILDSFVNDSESWRKYYESPNPEDEELPGNWESLFDNFDKLLLLKTLRLDRLLNGIQKFILLKIGEKFVEAPVLKLTEIFNTSNAITPLIFMVSSGSDPKADFDALSMKMGIKSVSMISLGQNQGPKAERMIKEACKLSGDGGWVFLQNCHLAVSWLSKLESICDEFSTDTVHPDFRLWMSTMQCAAFPVNLLRNSKKMTIEPPRSFKANLKITYSKMDNKVLDSCKTKPDEFRKLLFGLSIFHAVIQERKKYGSIGWNIPYEFTQEDFIFCRYQLQSFLDENEAIPYKVLNFVFAEINYGGRVTDDKDVKLINSLIRTFIRPESIQTGYTFSESGLYNSIDAKNHQEYINYIDSLPIYTSPEIMGLHSNSEILTNKNESATLLKLAKSIQPSDSSFSLKDSDKACLELIESIEAKTPKKLDISFIKLNFPIVYENSFNTVLIQESIKFNALIDQMNKSMANLKLAVEGLIVLNTGLEELLSNVKNYTVPRIWGQTFLSLKPLISWLEELNERVLFFEKWSRKGAPKCFWFNAFSFPQAFLTGSLQNFARKNKTPIDQLEFGFKVMGEGFDVELEDKLEAGVFISGLFMEGAKWDYKEKSLNESIKNELYSKVPVIQLIPQLKKVNGSEGFYQCPLYKTLTRSGTLTTTGHSSNFVMNIEFTCDKTIDHWIKRGTACFLALKE